MEEKKENKQESVETKTNEAKYETAESEILKEFLENPYNPENKTPDEILRLFYMNNVSILPVVSKRGILLGILLKDKVVAELSDIERTRKQKIDEFVQKLAIKMTLDDLLPIVGNIKQFVVINLFGEAVDNWSRLQLFAACEQLKGEKILLQEAEKSKEDQALEWMIYLVLEHIPRPLYAINEHGKTIFYNSHFEDLYTENMKAEVDIKFVEESLKNSKKNEFFYKGKDCKDMFFYNKDMSFYYEKVQMQSSDKVAGYLIYADKSLSQSQSATSILAHPSIGSQSMPLKDMLESLERAVIVDILSQYNNDLTASAKRLKITRKSLEEKISKFEIKIS